jgi:hypothetical protein
LGRLVGRSVGWLVGRRVGELVVWLVGQSVAQLVGRLVGRLVGGRLAVGCQSAHNEGSRALGGLPPKGYFLSCGQLEFNYEP